MGNLVKVHEKLSISADLIDSLFVHVGPYTEDELKQANFICLDGPNTELATLDPGKKTLCVGLGMFTRDTVYVLAPSYAYGIENNLAELREQINQARSRR